MAGVVRHRNTPGKAAAADGEVVQAAADEAEHFVALGRGADEIGVFLVMLQQRVLPAAQAEQVVGLSHPLHRRARRRQLRAVRQRGQFIGAVEILVANRVPAFVMAEIDLVALGQHFPQGGDAFLVARLGGADEIVGAAA